MKNNLFEKNILSTTNGHLQELLQECIHHGDFKGWRPMIWVKKQLALLIILPVILLNVTLCAASDTVDFSLPDIEGQTHNLSDFRGQWVIVNFWATWCSPCITEIPHLVELNDLKEPVSPVVIGIDFEEIETEALRKFMHALEMDYLVLRIGDSPIVPFEPLKGLPTTFIVSPQGKIVYRKTGPVTKELLLTELGKLVDGK